MAKGTGSQAKTPIQCVDSPNGVEPVLLELLELLL